MQIDSGDTPKVAGNHIVTQDRLVVNRSAVDRDAAATVHRVVLVVVVNKLITLDDRRDCLSLLVVAVTVVLNDVVFQQDFCRADAHKVGD